MTSRQQIKSLSVTSDPITAGLSEEMDMPPDNNHIANAQTHYLSQTSFGHISTNSLTISMVLGPA